MKYFRYCVWFTQENSDWTQYTNGFMSHITIKHSMSYEDALGLYSRIDPIDVNVCLEEEPVISNDNGFCALYYMLKPIQNMPEWWPNDAHVSFLYQYEPITTQTHKHCGARSQQFCNIALMDCRGYFTKWKVLQMK